MTRALIATAIVLVAGGQARADDRIAVDVAIRVGSATAPFVTRALSEVKAEIAQALSFVLGARFELTGEWAVGARIPAAPSAIEQPAGSYANGAAFGNPALFADRALPLLSLGGWPVRASVRAAIGVPVAYGGPRDSLLHNRSLAISDAVDGWRNPELWAPGTLPVTASGRMTTGTSRWQVEAAIKLPVLIRIGDADLPDEANTRPLGFVPHIELAGAWSPARWFDAGAAAFAVVQAPAAVEPASRRGVVQIGFEPRLGFRAGPLAIDVSMFIAVGGPLTSTAALGLGARYPAE